MLTLKQAVVNVKLRMRNDSIHLLLEFCLKELTGKGLKDFKVTVDILKTLNILLIFLRVVLLNKDLSLRF